MESQNTETKKRKQKSVCDYFERSNDDEGNIKGKCSHCSQVHDTDPCVGGTSTKPHSMQNSKNSKDVDDDDEEDITQHIRKSLATMMIYDGLPFSFVESEGFQEFVKAVTGAGDGSMKPDTTKVRKALAKMIIINELHFSFVRNVGFKELVEASFRDFTIPSPSAIAKDCCDYFMKKKMKLRKLFKDNKQRVCLATNIWTSEETVDYMCLTAQYIDYDWTLHNKIINFRSLFSGDGEDIGSTIVECLEEWGIENVVTITMDNASYSDDAISYLKSKLPNLVSNGKYLHIRCMTSVISSAVKEGFKLLNDSIERVRSAVRYVRYYPDRFKSCVAEKKLEPKRVFLDFPFRWDTTYDMLKMAPESEEAFDLCEIKDPDFKEVCENGVPSRIDWVYARKLASLLEFFKGKTMEMSRTAYVVANQFFSEDMDIDTHLHELKDELDPRFKLMANTMAEMFGKNWEDQKKNNMLLYFAVILDPRMKLEVIKYGFTTICNLKKEPNTKQEVVDTMVEDMVKDVTDEFGLLFNEYELMYQTTNSNDHDVTELQKYLKDATIQNTEAFDILQWWKLNTSKYPTLSKMAKELLAIPLSSVATESAFYTEKRVLDPYRSALPVTIIEALICTRDWVRKSRKDVTIEDFDDPDDFSDSDF